MRRVSMTRFLESGFSCCGLTAYDSPDHVRVRCLERFFRTEASARRPSTMRYESRCYSFHSEAAPHSSMRDPM